MAVKWSFHALLLLAVGGSGAAAKPSFRFRLPNGDRVPCPTEGVGCAPREEDFQPALFCKGVGHSRCSGGAPTLNQFGLDFSAEGFRWTEKLCQMDSDGDGATNGEELGDPCCHWHPEVGPPPAPAVSHPGFAVSAPLPGELPSSAASCTESGSAYARDREFLGLDPYNTFHIEGEGNARVDWTIADHPLPTDDTSYAYFGFSLSPQCTGGTGNGGGCRCYITGIEPIVHSWHVHHFVMYGCLREIKAEDNGKQVPDFVGCPKVFGTYTPGADVLFKAPAEASFCVADFLGSVVLQVHYTNPRAQAALQDRSGVRVHYTARPRRHIVSTLHPIHLPLIAADHIRLPPGKERHFVTKGCLLNRPGGGQVHVFAAQMHTHNLASEVYVDFLDAAGEALRPRPILHERTFYPYDQYFKFMPERGPVLDHGQYIQATCVYNTTQRKSPTPLGASIHHEMCQGLMFYYPWTWGTYCQGEHWQGELEIGEEARDLAIQHSRFTSGSRAQIVPFLCEWPGMLEGLTDYSKAQARLDAHCSAGRGQLERCMQFLGNAASCADEFLIVQVDVLLAINLILPQVEALIRKVEGLMEEHAGASGAARLREFTAAWGAQPADAAADRSPAQVLSLMPLGDRRGAASAASELGSSAGSGNWSADPRVRELTGPELLGRQQAQALAQELGAAGAIGSLDTLDTDLRPVTDDQMRLFLASLADWQPANTTGRGNQTKKQKKERKRQELLEQLEALRAQGARGGGGDAQDAFVTLGCFLGGSAVAAILTFVGYLQLKKRYLSKAAVVTAGAEDASSI